MSAAQPLVVSISIAQIRTHGWPRCIVGGGTMYLSIPAFVVLNLSLVVVLFQWVLGPLFALPPVRWGQHVFLDRGRIEGLFWLDRWNCQFCAYANGLCTMLNRQLDAIAALPAGLPDWKVAVASLLGTLSLPLWAWFDLYTIAGLYGLVISRCLGMKRLSWAEAGAAQLLVGYGAGLPWPLRGLVRGWKRSGLRLAALLEEIESAWCPLQHVPVAGQVVLPPHHERFLPAASTADLKHARNYLFSNRGTVVARDS